MMLRVLLFLLFVGTAQAQEGLVVSAQAGQLTLSWQDNATSETAYLIERSEPNDVCQFTQISSLGPDLETFVDAPLPSNARWCYRVRATDGTLFSEYSNVACGTVPSESLIVTQTFVRTSTFIGPFTVPLGTHSCTRVAGGTSQLRILRGTTVLKYVAIPNPLIGVPFEITCEMTPQFVTFKLDGLTKITVAP